MDEDQNLMIKFQDTALEDLEVEWYNYGVPDLTLTFNTRGFVFEYLRKFAFENRYTVSKAPGSHILKLRLKCDKKGHFDNCQRRPDVSIPRFTE